jgi:hypothetical protein
LSHRLHVEYFFERPRHGVAIVWFRSTAEFHRRRLPSALQSSSSMSSIAPTMHASFGALFCGTA